VSAKKPPTQGELPSREALLDHIAAHGGDLNRRDIARAFGLKGAQRAELRALLKTLEDDGLLERGRGRKMRPAGQLPPVGVVEIHDVDEDGDPLARPANWPHDTPPPLIRIGKPLAKMAAPGVGDRLLARLNRLPDGGYEARPMKRLEAGGNQIVGVFRLQPGGGGRIAPTERRDRDEYEVAHADSGDAADGDLVAAELIPGRRHGLARARVVERIGDVSDPHAISLIVIHAAGIPTVFPDGALKQAETARPAPVDDRTDLRDLPLVTIDGADARDFDDAVHARADDDPANPGGWRLTVAIADVAWYVRPGDPLDREAHRRGNSAYFPDRVVPMLPERLSNDLCSLRPREDRPCMAVELTIDRDGALLRHRFMRAMMRSAARLTYEAVQAAQDGGARGDDDMPEGVLAPLYGAFAALLRAREKRGTLELDLPERRVVFGEDRRVAAIVPVERLDSHRLIEEFMITANVAAARELQRLRQPCMYRLHDEPSLEKLADLREILAEYGLSLSKGVLHGGDFNRILARVAGEPYERLVNELVLRSQSQAVYGPDNIGHFGLGLRDYAHFTSPIRRYADLLVHRALIAGLRFGPGGLPPEALADFAEIGQHISTTERRATIAERNAMDRYTASLLDDRIGDSFTGTIRGVARFGLFVALADSGADGLVPVSRLPGDYYVHDESRHALVGERSGRTFRLGDTVDVRLTEADGLTGSVVLDLLEGGAVESDGGDARGGKGRGPQRRHPGRSGKPGRHPVPRKSARLRRRK
jgi:ribonuclease R